MPPPLLQKPCAIGANGGSRSMPGSSRCWPARNCRSRCGWRCSTSSTTSAVAAAFGLRRHRRIPTAASVFWSASTTPGTKVLTCACTAHWRCCSSGRSWTKRCCAVLPVPFLPRMAANGRSVGISPRAVAGWRRTARWRERRPMTWGPPTNAPSTPPITPLIRTATSGRIWPVITCCRCGAPSAWRPPAKTCAFWRSAGPLRFRPSITSKALTSTTMVSPTTAAPLIKPLTTGRCRV